MDRATNTSLKHFLEDDVRLQPDQVLAILDRALEGETVSFHGELSALTVGPEKAHISHEYVSDDSTISTSELRELVCSWIAFIEGRRAP